VLALGALALFVVPEFSAPRSVSVDTAPVAYLRSHLGNSRFFTLGPLAPNYGSYFAVASLNVNDLPTPSAFSRYIHARLDQVVDPTVFVGNRGGRSFLGPSPANELERNLAGYREAGVKYVLTPAGQALASGGGAFTLVFRSASTWIYELAGSEPYFTASTPGCTITASGNTRARVSCTSPTTLIRRETEMPGWHASVDGRSVPIRRSDGLFQAIPVPAGTHVVSFSYLPPYIVWGLVGLVLGCGLVVLGHRIV
jgi:membrane protein YfhO